MVVFAPNGFLARAEASNLDWLEKESPSKDSYQ